jgi:hypothetical protein
VAGAAFEDDFVQVALLGACAHVAVVQRLYIERGEGGRRGSLLLKQCMCLQLFNTTVASNTPRTY